MELVLTVYITLLSLEGGEIELVTEFTISRVYKISKSQCHLSVSLI